MSGLEKSSWVMKNKEQHVKKTALCIIHHHAPRASRDNLEKKKNIPAPAAHVAAKKCGDGVDHDELDVLRPHDVRKVFHLVR